MRLLQRLPVYAAGVGFTAAIITLSLVGDWSGGRTLAVALGVSIFYVVAILAPWLMREQLVSTAATALGSVSTNGHPVRLRQANGVLVPVESGTGLLAETRGPSTIAPSKPHVTTV